MKIKNIHFFIGSSINAILLAVIPFYAILFAVVVAVIIIAFVLVLIIDWFDKTKTWPEALQLVGFSILSLGIGLLAICVKQPIWGSPFQISN